MHERCERHKLALPLGGDGPRDPLQPEALNMPPMEALVRIVTKDPVDFGSGILIGREHVLTCIHVIDAEYQIQDGLKEKVRSTNSNEGFQHNREAENHAQGKEFSVITFDGQSRGASLMAVHEHLDLALLRLAKPVNHPVIIPKLQTDFRATTRDEVVGLGFHRVGENHHTIRRERLELKVSDSETLSARTSVLEGQAIEGMSGGPAIMARKDKGLHLIGILRMGGSGTGGCSVIRADFLAEFLEQHLGDQIADLQAESDCGLRPDLPGHHLPRLHWLRLKHTPSERESRQPEFARFIASRPLTFADIDRLNHHQVQGNAKIEREHFFAPMTAHEAEEVLARLKKAVPKEFSAPDPDSHLRRARAAAEAGSSAERITPMPDLILPPEWKSKRLIARGEVDFVFSGAPEWIKHASEGLQRAYGDPVHGGYCADEFNSSLYRKGPKALLRPVLTIPVWEGSQ